ncbi:MAG TPA: MFS transporter [Pseudonocardiaceae bacterium]|nr:MFS transporter [Pseudonocardiaceae bacterium]
MRTASDRPTATFQPTRNPTPPPLPPPFEPDEPTELVELAAAEAATEAARDDDAAVSGPTTGAAGRDVEPANSTAEPVRQPARAADASRARRGAMFRSLRERNYRLFAGGQVVSNVGTWMQRVAQDWLVLELSGRSPMALGIAAALQFLPTLGISMWAGVLADRMDKRRLLLVVQAGMGVTGLVLGLLNVTGVVALWHVYLLCLLLGCFSAVDAPVRQAFVSEMVGREHVTNAVALNSMTFNLARIVGPAIAGLMITWVGTGWVFLINAASFGAVIAGLLAMNPAQLHRTAKVPRRPGQLAEAVRYVRGRPDLVVLLCLVFLVSTFGMTFFATLANVAANVFHRNADGYGLLSTLMAIGTLAGSVLAARRSANGRPKLRLVLTAGLVFGVLEVALGLMPTYLAFGLALVPLGAALITFITSANSTMQLSISAEMRGRVMGLYMLVFLGGNPVGGPMTGWLAEEFGGRSPFIAGGVISVLAAVACGLALRFASKGKLA